MDDVPTTVDALIEVRRENLAFLNGLALLVGDVLGTNDPGNVPGDLNENLAELELHRERIVEDQDPRIPHGGPADPLAPSWMDAGYVILLRPNAVHAPDVEALERLVKLLIRTADLFDSRLDHGVYHT